ncbi:MAG: sulfite exporter TauE/SafE family protein [Nocardioides sp.]|uniref:sulfite exporter TauE/SafE family protein n=1 Tax=Nocardioides sp. TaxID=35761 RepID=UPI003F03487E
MDLWPELVAFVAGALLAAVTTPVGVSGAVFLLPVQLSVLGVPNPRVTPTNLVFNVVSAPGGLLRFARRGQVELHLLGPLLAGAVPGVVLGAVLRVHVVSDPDVFRLVAAAVLAPLGVHILRRRTPAGHRSPPRTGWVVALSALVGVVGGVYGIGGGSLLAPVLVGLGMTVASVAPVALLSTWVTSVVGVATYVLLAREVPGTISPDWPLGVAAGLGGLLGGWAGASAQPYLPERALRVLLGWLALALAGFYLVQAIT